MPTKGKSEVYSLEASPFYRMGRQADLASLSGIDLKTLKRLGRDREKLYWRKEQKIGEKLRRIACPVGPMRKLHDELKNRLSRIRQPDYLYSPRRKHTAAGNASLHETSAMIAKLDIRQFYPSTTDEHVFRFFCHRLKMAHDVAGLLTKLCTVDGRLPFGSPLSPVLCTLVHRDLFDQIHSHTKSLGLRMSLWVDDITISGARVSYSVIWTIRQMIHAKGLRSHKAQLRHTHLGTVITGYYLHPRGQSAANKHHLGVRDTLRKLDNTLDLNERLPLIRSLLGKTNYARRIYPQGSTVRLRLEKRRDWLHAQRRQIQAKGFITQPANPIPRDTDQVGLPWTTPDVTISSEYLGDLAAMVPAAPQRAVGL